MKSEKRIRDLLEQYEFNKKMDEVFCPNEIPIYKERNDIIIHLLKWVLEDN